MDFHNKAAGHERRLATSIADYYLRPKLAFYVVKRELAPLSISMKRVVHEIPADKYTRVYIKTVHKIELWASNFALEDKKVNVVVKAWSIDSGEARFCRVIRDNFCLPANRSTEISEFDVPVREQGVEEGNTVVAAYLTTDRGDQIARCTNWPEPLKFTPLKQPKDFRVETSPDGTSIRLSAEVPVKGTSIEAHVDGVSFSDNCVDLVPDETTIIGIKGLDADDRSMISVRYLGM
ncbi:MAG: hypothetical protein M1825_000595 [Sarcosagium campestre]|nr:MAG: hypothetical protein M1825_000595 [Sarcosagium campestre]